MGKEVHLASGTLVLLLISFANLCLAALPVFYPGSPPAPQNSLHEKPPGSAPWRLVWRSAAKFST